MMLILIALALAALPLMLLNSFSLTTLTLVSVYAALAHLLVLGMVLYLIWFSMRHRAILRVWRQRNR